MHDVKEVSDPRLKAAAAEIIAILARYDIAAQIHLVSETHSEYVNWIFWGNGPSWSALTLEPMPPYGSQIRLRAKVKTGGPEEFRKAEATVHMAHQLRDLAADAFGLHDKVCKMMHQHMNIDVGPRRHTPHESE